MHWRWFKSVGLSKALRHWARKDPCLCQLHQSWGNAKAYGKLAVRKVSLSNELSNEGNKLEIELIFHVSIVL